MKTNQSFTNYRNYKDASHRKRSTCPIIKSVLLGSLRRKDLALEACKKFGISIVDYK